MHIGTSIKTIRKQKKLTQKELASMCGISAHALCNIEKGVTFPAKETINKICQSLAIPESYLLLFSLTEEEIPEDKRILYRTLCEPLKKELLDSL